MDASNDGGRIRIRLVASNRGAEDVSVRPEPTGVKSTQPRDRGETSHERVPPRGPVRDRTKTGRPAPHRHKDKPARDEDPRREERAAGDLLRESSAVGYLDTFFWTGFVGAMRADALFEMACASPGLARVVEVHYAGRVVWDARLLSPIYAHVDAGLARRLELTEPPERDERSRALNLRELRFVGHWDPDPRGFDFRFRRLSLTPVFRTASLPSELLPEKAFSGLLELKVRLNKGTHEVYRTLDFSRLESLRMLTVETDIPRITLILPYSLEILNAACDAPSRELTVDLAERCRLSCLSAKNWSSVDVEGGVPDLSRVHVPHGALGLRSYVVIGEDMERADAFWMHPDLWKGLKSSLTHLTGVSWVTLGHFSTLGNFERMRVLHARDPSPAVVAPRDDNFLNRYLGDVWSTCTHVNLETADCHPWDVAARFPRLEVLSLGFRGVNARSKAPKTSIRELRLEHVEGDELWHDDAPFLSPFLTPSLRVLILENLELETPESNRATALRRLDMRRCDLRNMDGAISAGSLACLSLVKCTLLWHWYRSIFGVDDSGVGKLERLSIRDSSRNTARYAAEVKHGAFEALLQFHERLLLGELGDAFDWSNGISGLRRLTLERWDLARSNPSVLRLPEGLRRLDLLDPGSGSEDKEEERKRSYAWNRALGADWMPAGVEEVHSCMRFLGRFREESRLRFLTYTDRWMKGDATHTSDLELLSRMTVPRNLPPSVYRYSASSVVLDPWDDRRLPESIDADAMRVGSLRATENAGPPIGLPSLLTAGDLLVEDVTILAGVRRVEFNVLVSAVPEIVLDDNACAFVGRSLVSTYVDEKLDLVPTRVLAPQYAVVSFLGVKIN